MLLVTLTVPKKHHITSEAMLSDSTLPFRISAEAQVSNTVIMIPSVNLKNGDINEGFYEPGGSSINQAIGNKLPCNFKLLNIVWVSAQPLRQSWKDITKNNLAIQITGHHVGTVERVVIRVMSADTRKGLPAVNAPSQAIPPQVPKPIGYVS